ncbi:hypothetical protein EC957_008447 [Mortierella hygrophila]|uniref:Uncharacterized protein n=1 Tax=Mortierella hygrophila TaxID=979708 RepID=A0A9P6FC69_9FUNG|nr:hypothetical protein EC957_008447 [Mortierella hygrophila]
MPNTSPNNHSPDNHSPKRSTILKNLRLPWKKKKLPHKLPAQVSLQQHEDPEVAFQDSLQPLQAIHGRHYEHQHRRILSQRSSGITMGTDCHSMIDAHSEFSLLSPRSPVFRYRMLYGPSIENIENMGETHHPDDKYGHHHLLTSEDEFIKEMDKELAQATVHVMKKRNAKQLRLCLSIEGARPGSGSIVSTAPSTPVSVVRCKTSRGTYNASCLSSPTTPTSSRSFLRCKTSRGTYDAFGPPTPTPPTSVRSLLSSSLPLKSPDFSQRFSSKVAPSPSPSRHASPKPPPLSRLASFSSLQNYEGPIMLTKKYIEHMRRIENRLHVLENSAPHVASSVSEQQLQKQCQPVIDHTPTPTPVREEPTTSRHQQHLRIKPSLIRRVDTSYDFRTHMLQQRRISAIDRTDCQSPTSSSFPDAAASRSFSFHDWGSRWSFTAATAATAAAVTRASRHSHEESTDGTEQLLEKVKERVAGRIRLESALRETEALLRQYKTLVVQDWELKLDSLRTNGTATAAVTGQEQQQQQQHYQQMNERRIRSPQELPCEVN